MRCIVRYEGVNYLRILYHPTGSLLHNEAKSSQWTTTRRTQNTRSAEIVRTITFQTIGWRVDRPIFRGCRRLPMTCMLNRQANTSQLQTAQLNVCLNGRNVYLIFMLPSCDSSSSNIKLDLNRARPSLSGFWSHLEKVLVYRYEASQPRFCSHPSIFSS